MSDPAKLPPLFHVNNDYEYQRSKVTYISRDDKHYKFRTAKGGILLIDITHTDLIFGNRV